MKVWLRHHRQALAAALGKIAAQRGAAVLNALVIGIALSLRAGGYALLASMRAAGGGEALLARLKVDARWRKLRFVPPEQALQELQASEGLAEVVAALNRNPLPDAFVLRPKTADAAALEALAAE